MYILGSDYTKHLVKVWEFQHNMKHVTEAHIRQILACLQTLYFLAKPSTLVCKMAKENLDLHVF
jgi:hypothetical protein